MLGEVAKVQMGAEVELVGLSDSPTLGPSRGSQRQCRDPPGRVRTQATARAAAIRIIRVLVIIFSSQCSWRRRERPEEPGVLPRSSIRVPTDARSMDVAVDRTRSPLGQDLNAGRGRQLDVQSLTGLDDHVVTLGGKHEHGTGACPAPAPIAAPLPPPAIPPMMAPRTPPAAIFSTSRAWRRPPAA